MKLLKKLDSKKIELLIIFIIFVSILLINFLTPILTDDFYYALRNSSKISGLKDIVAFQIWHYLHWGGRTIAHTIVQIGLLLPKSVFNIVNSIVNILEVYLIYRIAKKDEKSNPIILLLIYLLLWFFLPVWGVSNIWLTGSCNYLWTTVIILFFIMQYQKDKKDNYLNIILMLFLGIIAGWTNENTSFGCIITVSLLVWLKKINGEQIMKWHITGIIGNIIGFCILILAPGNYVRSQVAPDQRSFFVKIISRFLLYTENVTIYLLPLLAILIIVMSIYIYKKKKIDNRIYPFIIGSFFSIYSMLLSPQFPARAWTGVIILLIIPIVILLFDIKKISKLSYIIMIDIIIISTLIYTKGYIVLIRDTNKLSKTWQQRETEIKKLKKAGKTKVEFERYYTDLKRNPAYQLADIENDPKHWANRQIANYYGLTEVKEKENK